MREGRGRVDKPMTGRRRNRRTQYVTFEVQWPGPLDVLASLEIFRRWGDDLLDRWDGSVLVRSIRVGAEPVPFVCTVTGTVDKPSAEVLVQHAAYVPVVEQIVRNMFVTAPEPLAALAAADPVIARLETRYRGVRPVLQLDPLAALVRAISAQQVNLRWAAIIRRRLVETFGCPHTLGAHAVFSLEARRLAIANTAELRALQFSTRKAEYLIDLATAVANGALDLTALRDQPDAEVITRLTTLRGLGRWTAEWFLARTLGRPCVAAGDLGVRKAIGATYLQGRLPSETEVRELTAHWGAAAGVAQQLVLHALGAGVKITAPQ
jgi:DNA-3-methyladenine glycosylase II